MEPTSIRERLTTSAFELFDERGYERTTVTDIAERAGVGRTTVFRSFESKEDLIFPDHDAVIAAVESRLATSTADTAAIAVREAARLVLAHYLLEGDRARSRYRLTNTVPALREREIASVFRYQRVFRRFIRSWLGPTAELDAELMAAAVVTAHNHVLREWLQGRTDDPVPHLDRALADVVATYSRSIIEPASGTPDAGSGDSIIVIRTRRELDRVLPVLRDGLARS